VKQAQPAQVPSGRRAAGFALLAFALAAPAMSDRLSDKDLKVLLQDVRKDVNALHKAIEPQYRAAVIRNERGEFKVSEVLDDLEKSANDMASSVGGRNDANAEVTRFLTQAAALQRRAEEGRWMLGAEEEWASLEPRLASLAEAYGGDFGGDPASWKLARLTDQQVGDLAATLSGNVKGLRSPLNKALKKDKTISPGDRDSLLDNLDGLSDAAAALGQSARKGLDADAEVARIERHAGAIGAFLSQHSASMATINAPWGAIERSIGTLKGAFG
jgi:hypothetical protein